MHRSVCLLAAAAVLTAASASAQPYQLVRSGIVSGGGVLSDGVYSLTGSTAQPAAGTLGNAIYSLDGGVSLVIPPEEDPCLADVNNDGSLDGADFNAWLNAFSQQDPAADQNGDGALNGADFNAWLANFQAGCS